MSRKWIEKRSVKPVLSFSDTRQNLHSDPMNTSESEFSAILLNRRKHTWNRTLGVAPCFTENSQIRDRNCSIERVTNVCGRKVIR